MNDLPLSPGVRRLTENEKAAYARDGFVKKLPLFGEAAVPTLQRRFYELAALLPEEVDISRVNMWHKANRWVHDVARTPAILDYVEDLIGPNFYQWGGQFFVKYPGDGTIVPWHQDAQYWPLTPRRTVTVWLAIFDTGEFNGAMRVVKGSHREGEFAHQVNNDPSYVLEQEVDDAAIDPARVVSLDLDAGEISLHDDGLLHGSLANESERVRVGMTMRYSPTHVECDLSVWPTFEISMARGVDEYGHNPVASVPTGEGFPVRKFQSSSEFT